MATVTIPDDLYERICDEAKYFGRTPTEIAVAFLTMGFPEPPPPGESLLDALGNSYTAAEGVPDAEKYRFNEYLIEHDHREQRPLKQGA